MSHIYTATVTSTVTTLYPRKESSTDPQSTRKLSLCDQKPRDCSLKKVTDPVFIRCHAPNMQGGEGIRFTRFHPRANLKSIESYSTQDSVCLSSRACMRSTEVADVQAMDVSTLESSSRMFLKISRLWISSHQMMIWFQGTSTSWISTHTLITRLLWGAQHSAAAAVLVLNGSPGMQDPEQPAPPQGASVKLCNTPTWTAHNSILSSEKTL